MYPNFKGSQEVALVGVVNPQSSSAAHSTGWVDVSSFRKLLAVIAIGAITGGGTVDAKLEQDDVGDGTHTKNVASKALTQIADTGGSKQHMIDVRPEDLDYQNGFKYVRLTVTSATQASLIAGLLFGMDPRYGVGSDQNAASVVQIV